MTQDDAPLRDNRLFTAGSNIPAEIEVCKSTVGDSNQIPDAPPSNKSMPELILPKHAHTAMQTIPDIVDGAECVVDRRTDDGRNWDIAPTRRVVMQRNVWSGRRLRL